MNPFSSSNTYDPNTAIPSLTDRIYVVTGGSAGIGFGIVAHLLQHDAAKIYLLSNKEQHADEALQRLRQWGDVSRVQWRKCDLADLVETREVARVLKEELEMECEGRLDALVANAGLGVGKYWETGDGLDSHFQVNHLSQMLLILTLLPLLQHTPNSRIVCQSSDLHRGAPSSTAFASKQEINTDIGPMYLYNRSKLAQLLFVRAVTRRLDAGSLGRGSGGEGKTNRVFVNATHPGAVETDQQEQAVEAYGLLGKVGVAATRPFMKDPVEDGCRSALWAATADEIVRDGVSGQYVVPDCKVVKPSKMALDEQLGERLWGLSEGLLKERFGGTLPY